MGESDEIEAVVNEYGWYGLSVYDHELPFLYTVGLLKTMRHPAFILFGIDLDDAYAIIAELFEKLDAGMKFNPSSVLELTASGKQFTIGFRQVHESQHPLYLGYAMGFCRRCSLGELSALQVFWADRRGKFPFDAGCDLEVYQRQSRLDISLTPSEIRRWERQWE